MSDSHNIPFVRIVESHGNKTVCSFKDISTEQYQIICAWQQLQRKMREEFIKKFYEGNPPVGANAQFIRELAGISMNYYATNSLPNLDEI